MASTSSCKFLFHNGVVSDTPSVSTFLSSHPGAYTTTRTHNNGKLIIFWDKHLQRLANSATILYKTRPELFFQSREDHRVIHSSFPSPGIIRSLVDDSVSRALAFALRERRESGDELAITALVNGNSSAGEALDVFVHVHTYVRGVFGVRDNGARLAVVGRGRDVAEAKYSDWVRLRKPMESLRPHSVTELLLSNDGDRILEGCVTNFFVVCRKDQNDSIYPFEIQTAPVRDGVLPGVIRQVIIDICSRKGIHLREVAPSWLQHEMWEEAFTTNSLRLLQHVETIQVPTSWNSLESRSLEKVTWIEKRFEECPGRITAILQQEIMKEVLSEGYALG